MNNFKDLISINRRINLIVHNDFYDVMHKSCSLKPLMRKPVCGNVYSRILQRCTPGHSSGVLQNTPGVYSSTLQRCTPEYSSGVLQNTPAVYSRILQGCTPGHSSGVLQNTPGHSSGVLQNTPGVYACFPNLFFCSWLSSIADRGAQIWVWLKFRRVAPSICGPSGWNPSGA